MNKLSTMRKEVVRSVMPFSSNEEAIAGVATNVVMTPATTKSTIDANTSMSWNDLEDKPASFVPSTHDIAGTEHSTSTLANLNSKISDATLIDTNDARLSDARTPTTHTHGGGDITSAVANATTATNCSRTVTAGTLLTGGGTLTGNITLNLEHGANWQPRRTVTSTGNPSGGADGDVWMKY